jgi:hypothetical protein
MGKTLSRTIRFSNWNPKRETETPWGKCFTNLIDGDVRVSEMEELVHAGNEDSPNRPMTQARRVDDGIVGSSVLATAERTSGYGDSSSGCGAVGSKFGSSSSSTVTS